jgi:TonB dependent receptor/TonB-dependent Receptor Plug Domain
MIKRQRSQSSRPIAACLLGTASVLALALPATAQQVTNTPAPQVASSNAPTEQIDIVALRPNNIGTAVTASEGVIDDQEIQLTPAYRPGQIFETVPGLTVTSHSGEGKANQFLLRGYNLDHGTDLETIIDGVPINLPTHAHGQGYTDLNYLIPELVDQITYTKGPYYADVGDFGAVGSIRASLRDTIPDQVSGTIGTFGFERSLFAGSMPLGVGNLLAAAELQHYDGPFVVPDDQRKENAVLRYSEDREDSKVSLTGTLYHNVSTNTTDIPERAIAEGFVPDRFGSLDPTDGIHSMRASLAANYDELDGDDELKASAFYLHNELNIFNNFTQFLIDPVHGDQEDQFERRDAFGGSVSYLSPSRIFGFDNELLLGADTRYDINHVGRVPSEGQVALTPRQTLADPASFTLNDQVDLFAGGVYAQLTTHWTPQIRTVFGLREDYQHGDDTDLLAAFHETAGFTDSGARGKGLLQPKGSLIYTANDQLEFYVSAGEGFHSADIRGVNQDRSIDLGLPSTPLLARQFGEEIGTRAKFDDRASLTLSVYNLFQQSETIIDPDVGQDVAGPPSERYGVELTGTYKIAPWLDFDGNFSVNHARFTQNFDDGTGHFGNRIANAPDMAGSAALYLHDLGPWSGGLFYRYLGDFPISSGPCNNAAAVHDFPGVATSCANAPTLQGQIFGKGYGELNLDAHYTDPSGRFVASAGIYNLLDTNAPAAEFFYVDRLKSEIGAFPDGRADIHEHPLEPLAARLTLTVLF